MSRINTYHTLQLNAFSEACSGDDKDERSLKQWAGGIVAPGRDRARSTLPSPPLRTSVAVPAIADKRTHAFVRVRECKFSSSAESPSDSLIPRSLSSKKQLVKKGEKISKTSGICFLSQQIDLRLTRQIF